MKKKLSLFIAAVMVTTMSMAGCGLSNNDTEKAEEFVGDGTEAVDTTSSEDSAAAESSLVVVNGLIEPNMEESSASASTSTVEDAATEATTVEPVEEEDDKTVIVYLGDSQFANGRSDGTDIPSLVAQRVPDTITYNFGIGGSTASLEYSTKTGNLEDITSTCFLGMTNAITGKVDKEAVLGDYPELLEKMNQLDPADVDIYVLEYGTNDFFSVVPLDDTQVDY